MFIPPGENIVERKKCAISGEEFVVTDRDSAFYESVSPIIDGEKIEIPFPTLAPATRAQRRMAFRNERFLYKRKSDMTGKEIVTMYHPDDPRKVFETKLWHEDGWTAFDQGRDFDFSRPFFEQFQELYDSVPFMALYTTGNCENCEYTNWFGGTKGAKNCYLCFNGGNNEDLMYTKGVATSKDSIDMYFGLQDEHCYECVNCNESYGLKFSQDCSNCRDCVACRACIGCENCFGCINLANASYRMFNEQLTKEEYEKRMSELHITHENRDAVLGRVHDFFSDHPVRVHHNIKVENSYGDYLFNCKDVIGYEAAEAENVKFIDMSKFCKDSMDITGYGYYSDHLLESLGSGDSSRILFTYALETSQDCLYSSWSNGCNNLFGCSGLKHTSHAIFNQSFGKEEYHKLARKIIDHMRSTGEWGEFFPASMSPFGYNETIGNDAYPLPREEVERRGWNWYDMPKESYDGDHVVPLEISQYDERKVGADTARENIQSLTSGVLTCTETGQPFKILLEELKFYIQHELPAPQKHPNTRYYDRLQFMNGKILSECVCRDCDENLHTTHDPSEKAVLCEACYQQLVY